jgi:hypothetical protein
MGDLSMKFDCLPMPAGKNEILCRLNDITSEILIRLILDLIG